MEFSPLTGASPTTSREHQAGRNLKVSATILHRQSSHICTDAPRLRSPEKAFCSASALPLLKGCWRATSAWHTPTSQHPDVLPGGISTGQDLPPAPPLSFHSPCPCTIGLLYQKAAEGHDTTLSSPPLGTSITTSSTQALEEEQKESSSALNRRCSGACRGHSSLWEEAPVRWPSGLGHGQSSAPLLPTCSLLFCLSVLRSSCRQTVIRRCQLNPPH